MARSQTVSKKDLEIIERDFLKVIYQLMKTHAFYTFQSNTCGTLKRVRNNIGLGYGPQDMRLKDLVILLDFTYKSDTFILKCIGTIAATGIVEDELINVQFSQSLEELDSITRNCGKLGASTRVCRFKASSYLAIVDTTILDTTPHRIIPVIDRESQAEDILLI
jgi:hypothetical protein